MFFMRDNETLYPTTSEYNTALILTELKKIITDNGGKVQPQRRGQIVNRSFYREAEEERRRAAHCISYSEYCKEPEKVERLKARAAEHEKTAAELEAKAEASRRDAEHLSYIHFTLDGFYYTLSIKEYSDSLEYSKTPINSRNEYSKDVYRENLSRAWWTDDFYALEPKAEINADRREAANLIFNELVNANPSEKWRDGRRVRVPNTYDNRHHYEMIYNPERIGKVDF